MFVDHARLKVSAGDGGNGCVAFRREKYVPRGGPSGGDGGDGGDVVVVADGSHNTLLHLHHKSRMEAERGRHGEGSNKAGRAGDDVRIPVPPGTVVTDGDTGELLGDLVEPGAELVVARGGHGGRGNARFKSSTNRAPRRADPGRPGEERSLVLELKLLADVGLVGLPNAGKSTLLSRLSAARPKIADYPFTTLEPHLGVVRLPGVEGRTLVMADIPGLIEGAHEGAGLGLRFLRHVERCAVLAHLVDLSDPTPLDGRVETIRAELEAYSEELAGRPWILVGTKRDAVADDDEVLVRLDEVATTAGVPSIAVSSATGDGLDRLLGLLTEQAAPPDAGWARR